MCLAARSACHASDSIAMGERNASDIIAIALAWPASETHVHVNLILQHAEQLFNGQKVLGQPRLCHAARARSDQIADGLNPKIGCKHDMI